MYCYLLWFALSGLGLWLLLQLRINLVDLSAYFGVSRWVFPALHNFGIMLLAIVWLGAVFFIEHYLRQGMEIGRLWARAVRVLWVKGILLGVSYLLQVLLVQ